MNNRNALWMWCVLAIVYSIPPIFLSVQPPPVFTIADERAAFVISQRIARGEFGGIEEPLNTIAEGLIHPRGMTVQGTVVVPEGFIGLPLFYGALMAIGGWEGLPYLLLPLTTIIAAFALGRLLLLFFPSSIARVGAVAYPILPPVLYYSFHPYVSNLLQWNLFMIAMAAAKRPFLAGVIAGIAVALRPVELPWMALLGFGVLIATRPSVPRFTILSWLAGMILPGIALGIVQQQMYGNWWSVGYAANSQFVTVDHQGTIAAIADLLKASVFPFGLSITMIATNLWNYHVWLFWWILPLSFLALLRRTDRSTLKKWAIVWALPVVGIVAFYGSWSVHEHVDLSIHAISTGFVRYWILLAVFWIPLIVMGSVQVLRSFKPVVGSALIAVAVVSIVLSPLQTTTASIAQQWDYRQDGQQRIAAVSNATPKDAVLIVKYSDKVYFPTRRVLVWYQEPEKVRRILPQLVGAVPVYVDVVDEEGEPLKLPPTVTAFRTIAVSAGERLLELAPASSSRGSSDTPIPPLLSMPFTPQAPE